MKETKSFRRGTIIVIAVLFVFGFINLSSVYAGEDDYPRVFGIGNNPVINILEN